MSFEKAAVINEWPENRWAAILHATLTDRGLNVFSELPVDDCSDYTKLKAALLDAYHVVPEVHRSRFRNLNKQGNEIYSVFAFTLSLHFKRSFEGDKAFDNMEQLQEIFKLEQFYK